MSANKNIITKVSMTIEHQADGQGNIVTLHASQGEQAILTSFNYQNYDEFCQQLLQQGFIQLAQVVANPPEIDLAPEPEITASPATKVASGPFQLEQGGKRRKVTMFDPFDLQEKYMKNKDLSFESLAEAKEVAQALATNDHQVIRVLGKGKKEVLVINEEVVTEAED